MTTCPSCSAVYDLVRFHPQSGQPIADTHTVDARGQACKFAGKQATSTDPQQAFFAQPQADISAQLAQLQAQLAATQAVLTATQQAKLGITPPEA